MNTFEKRPVAEQGLLENISNQLVLAKKLDGVYAARPDMQSFVGTMPGTKFEAGYTADGIARDAQYVKTRQAAIAEKNSSAGQENLDHQEGGFQLSEIMQAMIVDRMNKHWFKDCKAIMTSEYDDLSVGIDAVLKHERGGYLGAAFDFTVTNQDKIVYKKLEREWDLNTKDGKVPSVKYFQDPDTGVKGRLLVPKFIIGASKKDVEELAKAYLEDNQEVLDNHPFKYVMLLQVEEQLQTVLDYYESKGDDAHFVFAKTQYARIQTLLRGMKNDVHMDENMHNVDLYEYSKQNVALDMMRRFRVMRSRPDKTSEEATV